ncbi:MAG: hypothetical protein SFY68_12690 [Candidatus Sumerlaeia bacterium]|nr:hypothetical protein [Candidatus Sumerlaeia bacterium]
MRSKNPYSWLRVWFAKRKLKSLSKGNDQFLRNHITPELLQDLMKIIPEKYHRRKIIFTNNYDFSYRDDLLNWSKTNLWDARYKGLLIINIADQLSKNNRKLNQSILSLMAIHLSSTFRILFFTYFASMLFLTEYLVDITRGTLYFWLTILLVMPFYLSAFDLLNYLILGHLNKYYEVRCRIYQTINALEYIFHLMPIFEKHYRTILKPDYSLGVINFFFYIILGHYYMQLIKAIFGNPVLRFLHQHHVFIGSMEELEQQYESWKRKQGTWIGLID